MYGEIDTQASDVIVRHNVGDSFDHNAPTAALSHLGLISLKRDGRAIKMKRRPSRAETNKDPAVHQGENDGDQHTVIAHR